MFLANKVSNTKFSITVRTNGGSVLFNFYKWCISWFSLVCGSQFYWSYSQAPILYNMTALACKTGKKTRSESGLA